MRLRRIPTSFSQRHFW